MAAVPETEAQLKTLVVSCVKLYEQARMFGSVNSSGSITNLVAMQATLDSQLVGTQLAGTAADLVFARANLVAFLKASKPTLERLFTEYGKLLNYRGTTFALQWPNVFRDYSENAKRVTSRGLVFGNPSAITGVGNGAWNRLYYDQYGNVIENCSADPAVVARCTQDANGGVNGQAPLGEEQWSIGGSTAGRDNLEEYGSGAKTEGVKSLSAASATRFGLINPSFSSSTPVPQTTAPTDITGWTSTQTLGGSALAVNGTNYQVRTDSPYRAFNGDRTPAYLRVLAAAASFCLSQNIEIQGASFQSDTPYYFHVAVRRQSNATGTLTLRVGNASASVDLSTLTNNVWTLLKISSTIGNGRNWFKVFGKIASTATIPQLTYSIECPNLATGNVDLDDNVIGPYVKHDGLWYAPVGGSTPFVYEDKSTWGDNEYAGAVTQKWLWRGPGVYLPGVPVPPTAAPTAALAGTGVGNIDNGTHVYVVTFVDVNGQESGASAASAAVNVVDKTVNGKVTVTRPALPSPSTHLGTWNVYRSAANTATPLLLVATGIAIGTTTYTDNTADSGLGAQPPAGVTLAEPS